jgi:hypothetical protein
VPGLGALNAGGNAHVYSVSCASAGNCAAGGYFTGRGGGSRGFVAGERNGRWGKAAEVPGLRALGPGVVVSVSCASAGNCAAEGYFTGGKHITQGFVAGERNGRWGQAAEVPGLKALNTGRSAGVNTVSCATPGNCAAVGYYTDIEGGNTGFTADERNGRWGQAAAVRGLGALNKAGDASLLSVSCASAGNCAAGGYYTGHHSLIDGFVAGERNGRWGQGTVVPGLDALNASGVAQVLSVSCGSAGNCAAGGLYSDGNDHEQGFVVDEQNGQWARAIEVPGLGALNKHGLALVTTVSCGSAGNCAAGGTYEDRSGRTQGLLAGERNGRWGKAIEIPGLSAVTTRKPVLVTSVSCARAGNCAAGGFYLDRSGGSVRFPV